ncbi:hypothetical protein GCM10027414_30840 [Humibacter ginsengiterrae]
MGVAERSLVAARASVAERSSVAAPVGVAERLSAASVMVPTLTGAHDCGGADCNGYNGRDGSTGQYRHTIVGMFYFLCSTS